MGDKGEDVATNSDERTSIDVIEQISSIVAGFLKETPLISHPTAIMNLFENDNYVAEEDLDLTLTEFVKKYDCKGDEAKKKKQDDIVEDLKKIFLLSIPCVEDLPISTILQVAHELLAMPDNLEKFTDWPPYPDINFLDFVRDSIKNEGDNLSEDEVEEHIQHLTQREVLKLLVGWQDQVSSYVSQLVGFSRTNDHMLSAKQKKKIGGMLKRSRDLLIQLDEKIALKQENADFEDKAFESFYEMMRKDVYYKNLPEAICRHEIRDLYNRTDTKVRIAIHKEAGGVVPQMNKPAEPTTSKASTTPKTPIEPRNTKTAAEPKTTKTPRGRPRRATTTQPKAPAQRRSQNENEVEPPPQPASEEKAEEYVEPKPVTQSSPPKKVVKKPRARSSTTVANVSLNKTLDSSLASDSGISPAVGGSEKRIRKKPKRLAEEDDDVEPTAKRFGGAHSANSSIRKDSSSFTGSSREGSSSAEY